MRKSISYLLLSGFFLFSIMTSAQSKIEGWELVGSKPSKYSIGLSQITYKDGTQSAYLFSKGKKPKAFGALMQTSLAKQYRGKRIRMTAFVKTDYMNGWAGLWLRIDDRNDNELVFDNMEKRPIKENIDWKKYEIVLDIPEDAETMNYGALLTMGGKIWLDQLSFEVVDESVPLTDILEKPYNTDFEKNRKELKIY